MWHPGPMLDQRLIATNIPLRNHRFPSDSNHLFRKSHRSSLVVRFLFFFCRGGGKKPPFGQRIVDFLQASSLGNFKKSLVVGPSEMVLDLRESKDFSSGFIAQGNGVPTAAMRTFTASELDERA